jgi:transcriptional regulator
MHPDGRFEWGDTAEMMEFVRQISFSTLFVAAPKGHFAFHVPVTVEDGRHVRFHVARRNRGTEALDGARGLLSCLGPDAYLSPDWYGTPDQVPTWNYVAVEAEGMLRRLEESEVVKQLDKLSAAHEARLAPKTPWTRAKMSPDRFEAMTKAILGFEMEVRELRGTRKLAQHKLAHERRGAIEGMAAAGAKEMAELMREAPPRL